MTTPETLRKLLDESRAEIADYARGALPLVDVEAAAEYLTREKLAEREMAGDDELVT